MNQKRTRINRTFFRMIFVRPDDTYIVQFFFPKIGAAQGVTYLGFEEFRDARKLMIALSRKGYAGPRLDAKRLEEIEADLLEYAGSEDGQKNTVRLSKSGGWIDGLSQFRIGNREIPSGKSFPEIAGFSSTALSQMGTLAGWQRAVAAPAQFSAEMMLAISAAFAAPCLRFIGLQLRGFGLNFVGISSTGKSIAVAAAASTISDDCALDWNMTLNGFEDKAREHNDLPLTVDSKETVLSSRRDALADVIAHLLSSGRPRSRSKEWEVANDINKSTFRTVMISSEEFDGSRPRRRETGAALRLIDIPVAPAEGDTFGVVDSFPKSLPHESRAKWVKRMVKHMERAVRKNHGTAMPEFVRMLIRNEHAARQRLQQLQDAFLSNPAFADLNAQQKRMLEPFALCYAAGALAILFKIVPWSAGRLFHAVRDCALRALDGFSDRVQIDRRNAKRIMAWLTDPNRSSLLHTEDLTGAAASTVDYVRNEVRGKRYCYVRAEVLGRELGLRKLPLNRAMAQLQHQGLSHTDGRPDASTVQIDLADSSPRFYAVILPS